jgi:hypothetical protein
MKNLFSPTCDRYGHILTTVTGSSPVVALFAFPTAEEMAPFRGTPRTGRPARSSPERGLPNPGGVIRCPLSNASLRRKLVNPLGYRTK